MSLIPSQENAIQLTVKAASPARYRIAFLSQDNPLDQRTWSGITYHLYKQLAKHHQLTWVHANDLTLRQRRILSLWNRTMHKLGWKFTSHYFLNAWFLGRLIQKKLHNQTFDFAVVGAGESELIAYANTTVPVVYVADTTFKNMVNYYPWHTGLSKLALRQGNRIERNAIHKASHLVYSSSWAASSAVNDYGALPERISILGFGANLLRIPQKEELQDHRNKAQCTILFLGVQWERKGGPLAHEAFLELKRRGVNCSLIIIGCNPSLEKTEDLHIIPFIDKNNPEQAEKLFDILKETDFLLVPTRADCTPVVFSEAAAFGIPVITTLTGGVGSVIKEGKNGYCLPMQATGKDYADLIGKIWLNKKDYKRLRLSAREEYDERLNWSVWLNKFNALLDTIKTR